MLPWRDHSGQASVEFVALLPLLAVLCGLIWQLVLVGHTAWAAGSAARASARAAAVGGDPEAAARRALPGGLERRLRVQVRPGDRGVEVRVGVPSVAGLLPVGSIRANARFAPQGG